MNPKTTETPHVETQPQDQEAPHQWVTPAFERVPLNEALLGPPDVQVDGGVGWESSS